LLVFDNLEIVTDEEVFQFHRELPGLNKALVTSRHRPGEGEEIIRLEGFDESEASQFLQGH